MTPVGMAITTDPAPGARSLRTLLALAATALAAPFAVVLGWTARLLVMLASPVLILAIPFSPAVRGWLGIEDVQLRNYRGLRLPMTGTGELPFGHRLHSNHCWVAPRGLWRRAIGVDDMVCRTLGPVDGLTFHARPGDRVEPGDPLLSLRNKGRRVTLRSPVSGRVLDVNRSLIADLDLLASDPYQDGWIYELSPSMSRSTRGQPRTSSTARAWFEREVDRLLGMLGDPCLATAQDGGEVIQPLHEQLDDRTWHNIRRNFFEF